MSAVAVKENLDFRKHQTYEVQEVDRFGPALVFAGSEAIPSDGLERTVTWDAVEGATDLEIDPPSAGSALLPPSGVVRITPAPYFDEMGTIDVGEDSIGEYVLDNGADVPLRRVTLYGLRRADEEDAPELRDGFGGLSLLVSTQQPDGSWVPQCVSPAENPPNLMPRALATARYQGRVLTLPATLIGRLRLTLVDGGHLEDYRPVNFALDRIKRQAEYPPRDLELTGPGGQSLWSMPGPFPTASPPAETDVRVPLENALREQIPSGDALEAVFTLKGAAKSAVGLSLGTPHGALLRTVPDVMRLAMEGDPVGLDLGDPLDATAPATVTAGVDVRYDGLRILDDASDAVPVAAEAGHVVTTTPIVRLLPPSALDGWDVARIGIVGRAPEACELEVQLFTRRGSRLDAPMGPSATVTVDAVSGFGTTWVTMQPRETMVGAAAIRVTAHTGRFYWEGLDEPLVRVVVRDPSPAPQPLLLNEAPWLTVDADGFSAAQHALPPSAFAGTPPVFASTLFLTLDLSDLTLRYPR